MSALTFTSWQLTAGGILLAPAALLAEPALPAFSLLNVAGIAYLGLIGAALTYVLWFRGARLEPAVVSSLGFQPGDGRAAGLERAGPEPSAAQLVGMVVVVASVWLSQRASAWRAPELRRSGAGATQTTAQ